jgi:hypothetical protein
MATDPITLDRQAGRLAAFLQPQHRGALAKTVLATPPGDDIAEPYRGWLEDPTTVPVIDLLKPSELTASDTQWIHDGTRD